MSERGRAAVHDEPAVDLGAPRGACVGGYAGAGEGLRRMHALLLEAGGLVASLLSGASGAGDLAGAQDPAGATGSRSSRAALIAAAGPRAQGLREEYELLVEVIYEGYLLHYCSPRVVIAPEQDLALLAGDQLYAVGLARLVALGDTVAVAELADTITLSALAQAAGERELADAVWEAGARAVGWGPSEGHRRAKELLHRGSPEALDAMRTSAEVKAR